MHPFIVRWHHFGEPFGHWHRQGCADEAKARDVGLRILESNPTSVAIRVETSDGRLVLNESDLLEVRGAR